MAFVIIFDLDKSTTPDEISNQLKPYGEISDEILIEKNTKNNDGSYIAKIKINTNKKDELASYLSETFNNWYSPHIDKSKTKEDRAQQTKVPKEKKSPTSTQTTSTIKSPSYNFYKDPSYGKNLEDFIWTDSYNALFKIDHADDSLKLTTLYPGLLVGSGYNHPSSNSNDDYKLGFFFDHTTGLPLITGSSIKGVLRALFEDDTKFAYIQKVYDVEEERKAMCKRLFEKGEVIFYDAYIIATANEGRIFGSDYITSHYSDEELGAFKEPNPVKFLKILPEVTWQFQFKASSEDITLFKKIILDFGLGAKTNVGYGQFRE